MSMKQMGCEHENRVLWAMRSGNWTAELRQHAAGCTDCSEAMRVAEALQAEAERSEMQCHPPDPHWILERSRRLAREGLALPESLFTYGVGRIVVWAPAKSP